MGPQRLPARLEGPGEEGGPEVTARHVTATGDLALTMTNSGTAAVNLTVTNAYGGAARTLRVAAGGTATHTVDLGATGRWYDVKVLSDLDTTFLRRFAGHVETRASAPPRSGPPDPVLR
ncbi:phospholipase domain-containing protein [Streptomyces sp. NPDC090021]|uniref:phospholipase domain-containing protein n=1 Tax=Streptomyces sp. NPDC090021 TaxID=3365919 RepID=UPI0037F32176